MKHTTTLSHRIKLLIAKRDSLTGAAADLVQGHIDILFSKLEESFKPAADDGSYDNLMAKLG